MGITINFNLNQDIREQLSLFPESFQGIIIESNKAVLDCGNKKFVIQTQPNILDILVNLRLRSWRIKEDFLTLLYENNSDHSISTIVDLYENTRVDTELAIRNPIT